MFMLHACTINSVLLLAKQGYFRKTLNIFISDNLILTIIYNSPYEVVINSRCRISNHIESKKTFV